MSRIQHETHENYRNPTGKAGGWAVSQGCKIQNMKAQIHTLTNDDLAKIYRTSPRQIGRWKAARAPLTNPEEFWKWLYCQPGRDAGTRTLLDDPAFREACRAFISGERAPDENTSSTTDSEERLQAAMDHLSDSGTLIHILTKDRPDLTASAGEVQRAIRRLSHAIFGE